METFALFKSLLVFKPCPLSAIPVQGEERKVFLYSPVSEIKMEIR